MEVDCLGLCQDGACTIPCPRLDTELPVTLDTASQLWELVPGAGEVRYLCARDRTCAPASTSSRTTVTEEPDSGTLTDCSGRFSMMEPYLLRLSDGCAYTGCMALRK